jgi:hypothetical protein
LKIAGLADEKQLLALVVSFILLVVSSQVILVGVRDDAVVAQASGRIVVLDSAWGSLSNPSRVRPGAKDVPLIVELMNNSTDSVSDPLACIELNPPFYDVFNRSLLCSVVNGVFGERSTIRYSFRLSVGYDAKPGIYDLRLVVSYKVNDTYTTEELLLPVVVYPAIKLEVIDAGWGLPDQQIVAGPGDTSVRLYIRVRNPSNEAVRGVKATISHPTLFTISPQRIYSVDSISSIQP